MYLVRSDEDGARAGALHGRQRSEALATGRRDHRDAAARAGALALSLARAALLGALSPIGPSCGRRRFVRSERPRSRRAPARGAEVGNALRVTPVVTETTRS